MALTRDDLRNGIKRGETLPVYVLFGSETHLLERAVKAISDLAFAPGDLRDFNETSFSLNSEGNLRKALAAAQQLPMMAKRRVIRITDVRISATGHRDTVTEADESLISAYLQDPSPASVVIFIADELNGVRKMGKLLRDKAPAFEFTQLLDRELGDWARRTFKDEGVQIDEPAFRLFIERVGPDVRRLTNEVKKLAAAALPKSIISKEVVEELVAYTRELNNFEITRYLVEGRRRQAVSALRKILDDGVEPLQLLGLIAFNYRNLLIVKDLMVRGADRREVTSALKMPPSRHEAFLGAARRVDIKSLTHAVERIAKTDLDIKTSKGGGGPASTRMQLEMLVCELSLTG
jgi:DNA polymerase III subunit delta